MIINIRGTSGSGKSTIVKKVMNRFDRFDIDPIFNGDKIEAYVLRGEPYGDVYIIGRYETPCGGCDGISTQDEVCRLVKKYSKMGHVIFEGLIVTSCYKRYFDLLEGIGQPYLMLFLNTKVETCIESVKKRRASRGNTTEFNAANTISKYESTMRTIERAKEDGASFCIVSRNRAVEEILCQLRQHPFGITKR